MATVYFDEATRRFSKDDEPAVDGITIDIADGEFLVLVGPSGCGWHVALASQPGSKSSCSGLIGSCDCGAICPQPLGKRRSLGGDRRQPALKKLVNR